MFDKIKTFWDVFWASVQNAYSRAFKEPPKELVQDYQDTNRYNFLAVFVSKLNNLANTEATFDLTGDSVLIEQLGELMDNIESKRFDVTSEMLATGDCWVFPSTDRSGKLYHRYIPQSDVRILDMDAEKLTSVIGIIDKYCSSDSKIYYLVRKHTLEGNRLTVETYTTNNVLERVPFEQWQEFESIYTFDGADNIGVGRFKSPTSSRNKSPVYGVPLNYGCKEIEDTIFNDIAMIEQEFKNAKSLLFADPLILGKGVKKVFRADGTQVSEGGWDIPENLFPIDTRGGTAGANVDIFSPNIRYSEYRGKLLDDMHRYEQAVGTDKGFLTPFENATATTATEIRRANSSTIALIDKIRTAIKQGIESTIKADALFLNISDDLYVIDVNWYDAFADESAAYNRIKEAAKDGFAEEIDVMQWLFPDLSRDELQEKLNCIEEKKRQKLVDFNMQNIDKIPKDSENAKTEEQDVEQEEPPEKSEENDSDENKKLDIKAKK